MSDFATLHGLLERGAQMTRGRALNTVAMTREQVIAAAEKARRLSRDEIRRELARSIPKQSTGRGGLGAAAIDAMYADYCSGKSLAQVGEIYRRTRQTIFELFKWHGKPLRRRKYFRAIEYRGRRFTPGKDGYLRATSGDRRHLHYIIWEEFRGGVPAGHVLTFMDGNRFNVKFSNLACIPKLEAMDKTRCGHNQTTHAALLSRCRWRDKIGKPAEDGPGVVRRKIA